ncbi:hypothetical protein BpHYR1_023526 [Brachionus plicatilis]|uniref:Uncharacterized protein n=1 Tax=Brachionus plicatilis TaxID=10195 RepID=A0A3M7SCH2_BRAPC|nr:hypothetical protein BpHYR1_023526 [Brachionus plicatilis]
MNEINRPELPKKLPPQDRKKLSITFPDYDPNRHSNSSNLSFLNLSDREAQQFSGDYYKEPIDQPQLRNLDDEDTKIVSFFNDSIYLRLEKEVSISDTSEQQSQSNSYLSLDKFESEDSVLEEKKTDCSDNKSSSDINSLNESLFILEINDDPTKPPIPPKRTKKPLSLSKLSLASPHENKLDKVSTIIDEYFNYLCPNDPKTNNLESFRKEIFKNESNKICADCKRGNVQPNWISCVFFMTLCDFCAVGSRICSEFRPVSDSAKKIELGEKY